MANVHAYCTDMIKLKHNRGISLKQAKTQAVVIEKVGYLNPNDSARFQSPKHRIVHFNSYY